MSSQQFWSTIPYLKHLKKVFTRRCSQQLLWYSMRIIIADEKLKWGKKKKKKRKFSNIIQKEGISVFPSIKFWVHIIHHMTNDKLNPLLNFCCSLLLTKLFKSPIKKKSKQQHQYCFQNKAKKVIYLFNVTKHIELKSACLEASFHGT